MFLALQGGFLTTRPPGKPLPPILISHDLMSTSMEHFSFFFRSLFFLLLYNTILVLPYIDMNPPQVYMSSQS